MGALKMHMHNIAHCHAVHPHGALKDHQVVSLLCHLVGRGQLMMIQVSSKADIPLETTGNSAQ